jgi:hypothetical protein
MNNSTQGSVRIERILRNFEQYNCGYMERELYESGKGYHFGVRCSGYCETK